jgi:hypothetical protein
VLDQHRCNPCQQRKDDLEDTAGDAHEAKRDHGSHRQGYNHERGTKEAYNFYVHKSRSLFKTSNEQNGTVAVLLSSGLRGSSDVRHNEKIWTAEVYRFAGEIVLASPSPDADEAEARFEGALGASRKQRAKSWELRAAISMARLWGDQGKRDDARELLAPVYGWFAEGFDTPGLKEAKALLDE